MSDDYSFSEDPIIDEGSILQTPDGAIDKEEAKEMRKTVRSLGTEELDMKPDMPQSDNGLQIDKDTEEQDEGNALKIDESVTNDDAKPEAPKENKKSTIKEIDVKSNDITKISMGFTSDSVQSQDISKNADVAHKPQSSDTHKTTIITQTKTHSEPPILLPIIPKMVEAPTELLSVIISASTMTKPNIIQVSSISNDKLEPPPPSKYFAIIILFDCVFARYNFTQSFSTKQCVFILIYRFNYSSYASFGANVNCDSKSNFEPSHSATNSTIASHWCG